MPDTPLDFDQLEYEGYTVVHGFMDRARTQRIRDHMDSLLPPIGASREDPKRWHHVLRHPIPGAIMAELLNDPALLALAARSLKAHELRLLEQVLIRSDPRPPPQVPLGWHIDFAFFPRQYQALPRQTYFHMVHCLNTVAPGGAAFMVVPGSHQLTYAISAQMETAEELSRPAGLQPDGPAFCLRQRYGPVALRLFHVVFRYLGQRIMASDARDEIPRWFQPRIAYRAARGFASSAGVVNRRVAITLRSGPGRWSPGERR